MNFEPREIIMRVDRLGKLYARRDWAVRKRLAKSLGRAFFGQSAPTITDQQAHEFWALKDVSFELHRGEALGVIGLNGSGKTTLLRILAGQILPDAGEVELSGTSAAMIDLQAGFQPSASGRDNIFLRAAALGFRRRQTLEMIDEIIEFAEIGDAMDAPMETYSQGMKLRLAFAVMAMVQPDILFIDEILAVGDFRFRQKCLARIREMRARSAFVLVSHGMADIERFCDRAIVIHKGRIHFEGAPKEAIELYQTLSDDAPAAETPRNLVATMGNTFANSEALKEVEHYWCDETGAPIERVQFNDKLRLKIRFRSTAAVRNLIVGVPVWNVNAHYMTGLSTEITHDQFAVRAGETIELLLEVGGGFLNPGTLKSMLGIMDGVEFLYRQQNPDLVIERADHRTWGVVTIPHRWRLQGDGGSSGREISAVQDLHQSAADTQDKG